MENIQKQIEAIVEQHFGTKQDVVLTRPDPKFGDFATNVALQLAKDLGQQPRIIAEQLQAKLQQSLANQVSDVTVAGPGFINIRLTDQALLQSVDFTSPESRKGQTVVVETNNPNPFKAMHIGHAFNAILGDTIANFIEASGAKTHRVSYHGDVGQHVGRSMYTLLKFVDGNPNKLSEITKEDRNSFMSKMYAEGSAAYKQDEQAKLRIDELAKQSFTREDKVYSQVYDICKAWSFEQIDDIVARLGNKPIEQRFLESDADAVGVPIVRANVPKVFKVSDGALIFEGSKYGAFDNVFVSARGLGLYGARDLGLITLKEQKYHADKSYIVTAEEQRAYFVGVFAAVDQCMSAMKGKTINISTGTVKLPTGKMSSRSGDVVEISWLFDQVAEAIRARGGSDEDNFVSGVLRYQFLKVRVGGDVIFDINDAASIEGNSGPYLQYAHARAQSILAKSTIAPVKLKQIMPGERALIVKLSEYKEVIDRATKELAPHLVCTYLYALAQEFNRFYENNRVIGDPREAERLHLVNLYAGALKSGLSLLGIHAPNKM